ncbi:hypothetical protein HY375_01700 [Candidatus Berkelbacteria bacterium]|nr:hypothetical protein [Candidatus Berkelbacteria bacterium]
MTNETLRSGTQSPETNRPDNAPAFGVVGERLAALGERIRSGFAEGREQAMAAARGRIAAAPTLEAAAAEGLKDRLTPELKAAQERDGTAWYNQARAWLKHPEVRKARTGLSIAATGAGFFGLATANLPLVAGAVAARFGLAALGSYNLAQEIQLNRDLHKDTSRELTGLEKLVGVFTRRGQGLDEATVAGMSRDQAQARIAATVATARAADITDARAISQQAAFDQLLVKSTLSAQTEKRLEQLRSAMAARLIRAERGLGKRAALDEAEVTAYAVTHQAAIDQAIAEREAKRGEWEQTNGQTLSKTSALVRGHAQARADVATVLAGAEIQLPAARTQAKHRTILSGLIGLGMGALSLFMGGVSKLESAKDAAEAAATGVTPDVAGPPDATTLGETPVPRPGLPIPAPAAAAPAHEAGGLGREALQNAGTAARAIASGREHFHANLVDTLRAGLEQADYQGTTQPIHAAVNALVHNHLTDGFDLSVVNTENGQSLAQYLLYHADELADPANEAKLYDLLSHDFSTAELGERMALAVTGEVDASALESTVGAAATAAEGAAGAQEVFVNEHVQAALDALESTETRGVVTPDQVAPLNRLILKSEDVREALALEGPHGGETNQITNVERLHAGQAAPAVTHLSDGRLRLIYMLDGRDMSLEPVADPQKLTVTLDSAGHVVKAESELLEHGNWMKDPETYPEPVPAAPAEPVPAPEAVKPGNFTVVEDGPTQSPVTVATSPSFTVVEDRATLPVESAPASVTPVPAEAPPQIAAPAEPTEPEAPTAPVTTEEVKATPIPTEAPPAEAVVEETEQPNRTVLDPNQPWLTLPPEGSEETAEVEPEAAKPEESTEDTPNITATPTDVATPVPTEEPPAEASEPVVRESPLAKPSDGEVAPTPTGKYEAVGI